MAKSGMNPELRAEIPPALADWIAENYTRAYRSNSELGSGGPADKRQQTEQAARRLLK